MTPAPPPSRSVRRRPPLGRPGGAIAWTLAAASLAGGAAWTVSGADWRLDLVANAGAQVAILTAAAALAVAILRRRGALAVTALALGLHAAALGGGRAAWWPRPAALRGEAVEPGVVRLLHYNDSTRSDEPDVEALMEACDADVVSILCPPVMMQTRVIVGDGLEDRYPGKLRRYWKPSADGVMTEVTAGFVVSRWPVRELDVSGAGAWADRFIAGVVERPGAPFVIVAVHPRSPRTRLRWIEGNVVVEALAGIVNDGRAAGLPVVVLADLNATPTGWRSKWLLGAAGLRRAKPLLDPAATYPFQVSLDVPVDRTPVSTPGRPDGWRARWPAALAIDDALITPEIGVAGWTALGPQGRSDHRPVRVDLRIPPPAGRTGATNPPDR